MTELITSIVILSLASSGYCALPELVRLGALFDSDDVIEQLAVKYSTEYVNERSKMLAKSRLQTASENTTYADSLRGFKQACNLLNLGVGAILGPSSRMPSLAVQSICDNLEVPHIETNEEFRLSRADEFFVNLYPHPVSMAKVKKRRAEEKFTAVLQLFAQLVRMLKWERYALIYENPEGLIRMNQLLQHHQPSDKVLVTIKQLDPHGDHGVGQSVSSIYYKDAHILDLRDYMKWNTNISTVRVIDPTRHKVINAVNDWVFGELHDGRHISVTASTLKINQALAYDAVLTFTKAVDNLGVNEDFYIESLLCTVENRKNIRRQTELVGLTGRIIFDEHGFRSNYDVEIVKFKKDGSLSRIGQWDVVTGLNLSISHGDAYKEIVKSLENKTLSVITVENSPYVMKKKNHKGLQDSDKYEGFAIDIIREIASELKFNYTFSLIPGNVYGVKNPETNEWNGIIRELIDWRADLAILDLTITHERQEAVDFTTPFMSLGISILYMKPIPSKPGLLSFLNPFSPEVWIYVVIAYLGVSVLLYFSARMCKKEWDKPYPCSHDCDFLENKFNMSNSFWFTIGSLMQQGTDLAPKAIPTRIIASMWWVFTLIIVQSYTANLTAFLTLSRMESPISSPEDLARQTKIKYGCLSTGSTMTFFKNSKVELYQQLYAAMESQTPSVFTMSNQEGVNRVLKENGGYAFFMESTSIEYHVERNCKLQRVGSLLDSKGYGIAMPKKSPYIEAFNNQILKLQQENKLHMLKDKWWKTRKDETCEGESTQNIASAAELKLANVGGVFVVLLFGMGCACILAVIEFFWNSRKLAIEERVCDEKLIVTNVNYSGNILHRNREGNYFSIKMCSKQTSQKKK